MSLEEVLCECVRFFEQGDILRKNSTLFCKTGTRFSEFLVCGRVWFGISVLRWLMQREEASQELAPLSVGFHLGSERIGKNICF